MAAFIGSPPVTAMCLMFSWVIGFRIVFTLNFAYNRIRPDTVKHTIAASLASTMAIEWENVINWKRNRLSLICLNQNEVTYLFRLIQFIFGCSQTELANVQTARINAFGGVCQRIVVSGQNAPECFVAGIKKSNTENDGSCSDAFLTRFQLHGRTAIFHCNLGDRFGHVYSIHTWRSAKSQTISLKTINRRCVVALTRSSLVSMIEWFLAADIPTTHSFLCRFVKWIRFGRTKVLSLPAPNRPPSPKPTAYSSPLSSTYKQWYRLTLTLRIVIFCFAKISRGCGYGLPSLFSKPKL